MNINIYTKYEIKIYNKGSYISEEDSIPGDITFSKYEYSQLVVWDGARLLDYIQKQLADNYIMQMIIVDDVLSFEYGFEIDFEFFNYMNGEGHTIKLFIKDIKENDITKSVT